MAINKFFTIMIVPEKTQKVRRMVVPHYIFNGAILAVVIMAVLAIIMVFDYANVMSQISENKQLKIENRELRQNIQIFKDKIVTVENTLDRVKTFVTKLKIITNVENKATPVAPQTEPKNNESSSTEQQIETAPVSRHKVLIASLTSPLFEFGTLNDAQGSLFVQSEFEKLDDAYEELQKLALEEEKESHELLDYLSEKQILLASMPTLLPTYGYITSDYGVRLSPYAGKHKMHEGIDIANRYGADIFSPAEGVVTFSGIKPGYGKMVSIDHGNGIETHFAHNSKIYVKQGDHIKRGNRIAAVGNSGHSTGPHLHYEIHANGMPVDPCWYILDQPAFCKEQ